MSLKKIAEQTLTRCSDAGAQQTAVQVSSRRGVEVGIRDGAFEDIRESATQSMQIELFVDGRYSSHRTSDLREDSIRAFVGKAVSMTRVLGADPHRGLADPKLYAGQPGIDLKLADPEISKMSVSDRKQLATVAHDGARSVDGILSVTAGVEDVSRHFVQMHSNGFSGSQHATSLYCYAQTTCNDPSGRKPNDYDVVAARWIKGLDNVGEMGRRASERAKRRIGQTKLSTGKRTVVVENRAARNLLQYTLMPLYGRMIQQEKSFWRGKKGEVVGSKLFTLVDEPHQLGGFGSRLFDEDGIATQERELFRDGKLTSYLIDVYYGRKLEMAPTSGTTTNVRLTPGTQDRDALIASVKDGLYVTGFQGGNSDPTRGEFSHGVSGFAIRDGQLAEPVGEMNLSGNHLDVWQRLAAVGNDPYLYGAMQTPTLVLEDVMVSGT
ncbi:MAG: TldD/PmbA family protein [Myxococcota bacterium]